MPVPPSRRRIIERRVAAAAIGLSALIAVFALGFRFVFPDFWWTLELPPAPGRGWEVFNLYAWLRPALSGFVALMLVGAIVRLLTWRRWATVWIPPALPVVVCLAAAVLHVPLFGLTVSRVDRVAGVVEEPAIASRALAASGTVTFALAALFLCVTFMRRTPAVVRQAAGTVAATLTGVVLVLFWLQMVLPISNRWDPARWDTPELLVPFRPCRGALLWETSRDRYDGVLYAHPVARIDDLWLRFTDPRANAPQWAVSAAGEWRQGYYWLNRADAATLWVRRDDPAVVRCDSRVRSEPVAPAAWHRVGLE